MNCKRRSPTSRGEPRLLPPSLPFRPPCVTFPLRTQALLTPELRGIPYESFRDRAGLSLGQGPLRRVRRRYRSGHGDPRPNSRLHALLAGRRRRRLRDRRRPHRAAASWPRATIPARPARPTSCGPTPSKAFRLIPGKHRFNLHAIYLETGGKTVEREPDRAGPFPAAGSTGPRSWASAWTSTPPIFAHPKAADGFTLAHRDEGIRHFWIEHGIACRKIGEAIGRQLGTPCVTNVWIPDGMKDVTIDRKGPRERLSESLDEMFAAPIDPGLQPRRRREQALRHRLGDLRGRLARVLPGLRRGQPEAADASTPATSIPPRRSPTRSPRSCCSSTRSCCTSAAASAGTATTW